MSARRVSASSSALSSTRRIRLLFFIFFLLQRKRKRRSLADLAFGPDPAVVAMDNPLNDRKPHPGAREFSGGVKALKDAEELVGVLHVEAGPVVANGIDGLAVLLYPG